MALNHNYASKQVMPQANFKVIYIKTEVLEHKNISYGEFRKVKSFLEVAQHLLVLFYDLL